MGDAITRRFQRCRHCRLAATWAGAWLYFRELRVRGLPSALAALGYAAFAVGDVLSFATDAPRTFFFVTAGGLVYGTFTVSSIGLGNLVRRHAIPLAAALFVTPALVVGGFIIGVHLMVGLIPLTVVTLVVARQLANP